MRKDGRAVECTALEMRQSLTRFGGPNPPLSATSLLIFLNLLILHTYYPAEFSDRQKKDLSEISKSLVLKIIIIFVYITQFI